MNRKNPLLYKNFLASAVSMAAVGGINALLTMPVQAQTEASDERNMEEVVVEGTRSSIQNSIDAKRLEESISDVLSADEAGRFPDNNIAEGLARIPGISFQRDNDTSDGAYISIRGLDASFNSVLNNGLRTGTADTFRRTPLDIISGDGLDRIVVTKAPLPEHASEGIGGVVDIRTKGALEKKERIRFSLERRTDSFDDRDGYRIKASATKHLSDNFGANLSVNVRRRYFNTLQIDPASTSPEFLRPQTFTATNGSPITVGGEDDSTINNQLDLVPVGFIPIEEFNTEQVNYDANSSKEDNLNISGTLDWEVSDTTTVTLGGRHSESNSENVVSRMEFDVDNDDFEPIDENNPDSPLVRTFDDPEINFRGFLADEEERESSLFLRGETELDNWLFNYVAGVSSAKRDRPILEIDYLQEYDSVPGGSNDNAISFAPFILNGIYTSPTERAGFEEAYRRGLDPFCVNDETPPEPCSEFTDFDEELEDSLLNNRASVRFDATRFFDNGSFLSSIKFGVQYEESEFKDVNTIISSDVDNILADGSFQSGGDDLEVGAGHFGAIKPGVVRSFGPLAGEGRLVNVGPGIPLFDGSVLRGLRDRHRSSFLAQDLSPGKDLVLKADESFFSGYFQAKLNFGSVDIIGGVRIEQYEADFSAPLDLDTEVEFEFPLDDSGDESSTTPPGVIGVEESTDNFEVLPRITLNYDVSETVRLRLAYTTAIARPTFNLLTGAIEGEFNVELVDGVDPALATINDVDDVSVEFELGNPELKNSYSQNFDLSLEYYIDEQNIISAAVYYKKIDDFIFSSFASPDGASFTQPENVSELFENTTLVGRGSALIEQLGGYDALINLPDVEIEVEQAQNGEQATVLGAEFGIYHTFSYLPGDFSNLGFIGNLTVQDTEAELKLGVLDDEDILVTLGQAEEGDVLVQKYPFFNSPEVIGNVALFYEDKQWEAAIAYRYSGLQLEAIENFGINQYQQGRGFLDFDIEYSFRNYAMFDKVTLYFSANDILDDGTEFSVFETRGKERRLNDNATFNGRNFKTGIKLRF